MDFPAGGERRLCSVLETTGGLKISSSNADGIPSLMVKMCVEAGSRDLDLEARRYAEAFRHLPLGMALAATDGRFLEANPALCELLGYRREELLELRLQDVVRLDGGGLPEETGGREIAKPCVHRDGSEVEVLLGISSLRDEAGEVESLIARFLLPPGPENRTAELQAAKERLEKEIAGYRRSEEVLRFTQFSVDYASDAMFWVAPDGLLLYVNASACRSLGYTVQELRAMNIADIVPDLAGSGDWGDFWESLKRDGHRMLETRHLAKDGHGIPIELIATFFEFSGQELLCASSRDISRRKAILEELSQARDAALESARLKSQFLANMSHEIRTPMNGVIGMAELLLHTNLDRDQRQYVDAIRSSADLLLSIINDILDSSKIDAGQLTFEKRDFDLREIVEEALDVVSGIGGKKGLELAGCVQPEVFPHLRGDSGRLRQVLANIAGNAVKFTEAGEVVILVSRLSETETGSRLRFEIRDTGIGVSPHLRQRIFEPFIQGDGSGTRKYGGTGLGLTICRQIIEAMGGEIDVESAPGGGTTFWFTLDFEKQPEPVQAAPGNPECPVDLRVLVVDDNATSRQILQLQLSNLRLRSEAVAGSEEALSLLRRENDGEDPFDLAVLDLEMPGMDGLELASLIKSNPVTARTRLLVLSSLGDQPSDRQLVAAGVEGYLVKPLKQTRLHTALATLFSREPTPVPSMPVAEMPTEFGSRSLRILLAEDNFVNQKVALLQLKSLGYTADLVTNGADAVKAFGETLYDVVLMDCQMPGMDGYAASREIRQTCDHPVRIIAMTANAMEGDREKCLEAGMDAYLSKPVHIEDLGRVLDDCRHRMNTAPMPAAEPFPGGRDPVDLELLEKIAGDGRETPLHLIRDYLEQADEILACIVLAIERQSPGDIGRLAHKLAGSSAACGMRGMAGPLARLEKIREVSQLPTARDLHQEVLRELARIRRFVIHRQGPPMPGIVPG